jgi:tRNA pseudouridine55 synthase
MTNQHFAEGGLILIDKPVGWSSFDVVNKLRYLLKIKKIGHAGTLDPLATGLLIICTGKWTKRIESFQSEDKEYTGVITLGFTTPSYDLESEPDAHFPTEHITEELILQTADSFIGEQEQIPPIYSAIKQDGKKLYELARKGKTTEIKPRKVCISTFEITKIALPDVHFRVRCSKGTYLRSLVYDFGKRLNSGATLTLLRRTKSGDFDVKDALTLEAFIEGYKALQEPKLPNAQ